MIFPTRSLDNTLFVDIAGDACKCLTGSGTLTLVRFAPVTPLDVRFFAIRSECSARIDCGESRHANEKLPRRFAACLAASLRSPLEGEWNDGAAKCAPGR